MKKIYFAKMVASGNDFVVTSSGAVKNWLLVAKALCDRKFGIGADGLLLLENSSKADIKMRIFNADGSEAEMCGNGARCVSLYVGKKNVSIETKAGIIHSEVDRDNVKIRLTEPKNIKLDIPVTISKRVIKANFVDTGVPHAVVFVSDADTVDVPKLGRLIRYHDVFAPRGANVNFVEASSNNSIKVRTYERGVEDETLACGTGSVASSLIFALKTCAVSKVKVRTRSKDVLTVYFTRREDKFSEVWLEGKARIAFVGSFHF